MRILTKIFLCSTAILCLASLSAQATGPLTEPFSSPLLIDPYETDPGINNSYLIEDPSLGPYAPSQWGLPPN